MLTTIKGFIFNRAEYRIDDGKGNEVILKIDYADGKFEVEKVKLGEEGIGALIGEAKLIAFDLISRKSNNKLRTN